jgi:CheY-like chemotaxis protein
MHGEFMDSVAPHTSQSSVAVFSGKYCCSEDMIAVLARQTGCRLVEDQDLVKAAAELSSLPEAAIRKAFSSKRSAFDKFTHEKNRSLAFLRLAMADLLGETKLLVCGDVTHLISKEISHFMKVCLIGDLPFRVQQAMRKKELKEKDALRIIAASDAEKAAWTDTLYKHRDPWNEALYDIRIPMNRTQIDDAVRLIMAHLNLKIIQPSEQSLQAVRDYQTAARATVALVRAGHDASVVAKDGHLTVNIFMKVLMFNRLQEELKNVLNMLPGVRSVKIDIDPSARQGDVYRRFDAALPSKVLLVDDEKEFVQTLSERLIFRNVGTAVAYDGKSALEMVVDDDPDVLVLDLKMPGIDGMEVLRRVKKIRPAVEVVILTGHGSDDDRQVCMQLGAFAYLHKPVDIDLLTSKLKEAHDRVRTRKFIS